MAVLTLVFGFLQIRKSIALPFVRKPSAVTFKTTEQLEKERLAALKVKDTDSDSLTDYEELYIYWTSPYLEDSDSDGDSDSKEITEGNDPSCPKTKVCREPRTTATAQAAGTAASSGCEAEGTCGTDASSAEAPESVRAFIDTFGEIDKLTPDGIAEKIESMSVEEMRGFFIKMGVDEATADAADEETMREMLYDTFNQLGIDMSSY
jgi:hypothetical protein